MIGLLPFNITGSRSMVGPEVGLMDGAVDGAVDGIVGAAVGDSVGGMRKGWYKPRQASVPTQLMLT